MCSYAVAWDSRKESNSEVVPEVWLQQDDDLVEVGVPGHHINGFLHGGGLGVLCTQVVVFEVCLRIENWVNGVEGKLCWVTLLQADGGEAVRPITCNVRR